MFRGVILINIDHYYVYIRTPLPNAKMYVYIGTPLPNAKVHMIDKCIQFSGILSALSVHYSRIFGITLHLLIINTCDCDTSGKGTLTHPFECCWHDFGLPSSICV